MVKKDTKGRVLKTHESQMPDGRYRYRCTDKFGNTHTIYSWKLVPMDKVPAGKREDLSLREKASQLLKQMEEEINFASTSMTVSQLVKQYLETKISLTNTTRQNYIYMIEKNIEPSKFGKMLVINVKKTDVLKFYSYLFNEQGLAACTIKSYQNILYPAFGLAVDDNIIKSNPCNGCMKEYVGIMSLNVKTPLTPEHEKMFLEYVKGHKVYSKYYLLFSFMLNTGLRISEALGLTWDDIDLQNKYVSVNHQVLYKKKNNKCQLYIGQTKNKKVRQVPLKQKTIDEMNTYKNIYSKEAGEYQLDGLNNFIFLNSQNRPYYASDINSRIKGIISSYNKKELKKAQKENREPVLLPDFSSHVFRHTYCTRMAEAGMDIKVLQTIMGHQDIKITMQIYNHVDSNRVQNEVKRMKDVFGI